MKLKAFIFAGLILVEFYGSADTPKTDIYLTRHGQTHWNVKRLWQGTTDTTLNLMGVHQAVEKAEFFKDMRVDAVYCSPLQRAHLTAQVIAAVHEKVAIPRFNLMEPWQGKLQGMHTDDVFALTHSNLCALTQEKRRNTGYLEGLMSDAMTTENVESELILIGGMHLGGTVVAVTHSGVIEAILTMHTDAIHETIKMSNMAYLKYTYDGEKLTLVEVSQDIQYNCYK